MSSRWQKPANLAPGTVWRRFTVQINGEEKGFTIRDIRPQDIEECVEVMTREFLPDEPLCAALDTMSDPDSIATIQSNWRRFQSQGVSLACYADDSDQLVAVNNCIVTCKDDEEIDFEQIKGDSWRKVLKTLIVAESTCDVYKEFGTDFIMSSSGLFVSKNFRGHHIGQNMFQAREALAVAVGVPAAATVVTGPASQRLAARCGWRLLGQLRYADMAARGVDLAGCSWPFAQFVGVQYGHAD